jgi:dCTP deaminase
MTILEHESLEAAIDEADQAKRLTIMPLLVRDQIGPASVDVRLGTAFRLLRRSEDAGLNPRNYEDAAAERAQEHVTVPIGKCLWLHPGQFALGSTLEYLRLPNYLAGYVVGRSTWGRVGLLIATAILVGPGFRGCLTLELVNHGESPIALYPGVRIGQLAVHDLRDETDHGYTGGYAGQVGPEVPRLSGERPVVEHLEEVAARLGSQEM